MSAVNLKFIYANVLRAAELRIPINIMFSEGLVNVIEAWEPVLRMDSLSCAITLFNIIATTLEFSSVSLRSSKGRNLIPLNFYNMVLARSSYGKSDITNLIRYVLQAICTANEKSYDMCLDEFTRAGLMNSLDKCTKIFMTDEADMSLVDAGLFNGFPKPSAEANCRSLVMILYDRMFSPYVRRLANKTVVVEKSKLNLLGLSTGELMGTVVSRLKSGGSWDPIIGRFTWWVLDGPPIMEPLIEPVLNCSIPSIEQLAFASSLFNNCSFRYDNNALPRVIEWGNSMKMKSYEYRENASISALLGKSVGHAHRYAAFMQSLEFAYDICTEYINRFKQFPLSGAIDETFVEHIEVIFDEMFPQQTGFNNQQRQFIISDQVVVRAIDLVSGLLQQMKILMDDTNAPIWNGIQTKPVVLLPVNSDCKAGGLKGGKKKKKSVCIATLQYFYAEIYIFLVPYVSCEKLQRIAVEVMLFPSLCFTVTLLHTNSFLHNASPTDVHSVLEYLIKCELLECVQRGIKTSRRSTSVYIKRLPMCDEDGQIDFDLKLIFDEKLEEFKCYRPDFTIDEYLKKNMRIDLDAIGTVTNELVRYLSLPEYMRIQLDPLYNLKKTGDSKQSVINTFSEYVEETLDNHLILSNDSFQRVRRTTIDSAYMGMSDNVDNVSSIFDEVMDEIEQIEKRGNSLVNSEAENGILDIDVGQNVNIETVIFSNDNGQHLEHIPLNDGITVNASTTMSCSEADEYVSKDTSKVKQKKRRDIGEQELLKQIDDDSDLPIWSPPSRRLRSKKHSNQYNDDGAVSSKKKCNRGEK